VSIRTRILWTMRTPENGSVTFASEPAVSLRRFLSMPAAKRVAWLNAFGFPNDLDFDWCSNNAINHTLVMSTSE